MTSPPNLRGRIRAYLLGLLAGADLEELERALLVDDELFEEVQIMEDELIDEYVGGELTVDERQLFERNFLADSEGQLKLRLGRALDHRLAKPTQNVDSDAAAERTAPAPQRHSWSFGFFSSPLRIAIAALLIVVVALGAWRIFVHQSDVDRGLIALNDAYREQRPTQSRISTFAYAQFSQTRGGDQDRFDSIARDRAERILLDAAHDSPGTQSYHALGVLYLAEKQFDKAIEWFDRAVKASPTNARVLSDLGAALTEKGKVDRLSDPGKGLETLGRSLETLNKALQLDPNLLEAIFNRALCREELRMMSLAGEAWREYLAHDSTSQWAAEARQRLKAIESAPQQSKRTAEQKAQDLRMAYHEGDQNSAWRLITSSYNSSGNFLSDALLDSYLREEDGPASDNLEALSFVGQLAFERSGDAYLADLSDAYRRVPYGTRPSLRKARALMKDGIGRFNQAKYDEAASDYSQARQEFERSGDVAEAVLADYRVGHCYILKPDVAKSRTTFIKLEQTTAAHHYEWLHAQTLKKLAHLSYDLSRYSKAADYSDEALVALERTGDAAGTIATLVQLAGEQEAVNSTSRSLGFIQRAFSIAAAGEFEARDIWGIYTTAALDFGSLDMNSVALEYETEALRLALSAQLPPYLSRSYVYLADTLAKLKRFDEAAGYLEQAFAVGKSLATSGTEMMANASLHLGDLSRLAGNHQRAIEQYDKSIELYERQKFDYFAYQAHRGKLLSLVAINNDAGVAAEIQTVFTLFDKYRSTITDESQRDEFFSAEQGVYDVAIDFAATREQNPEHAFEYSETSRARSLRDAIQSGANVLDKNGGPELELASRATPRSLADLKLQLPEQVQVLQYAVLDRRVAIWLVTRSAMEYHSFDLESAKLDELVQSYLKSLRAANPAAGEELLQNSKGLYSLLIQPVAASLDRRKALVIVPDKILNFLPFCALVNPTSGRYLVQDFRIENAPSSNVFVDATEAAQKRSGNTPEALLAVGDPSFDKQEFPALAPLGSAAREAGNVAGYYPSASVLTGERATERVVREQIRNADVVHLATHFVADPRSPMRSKLVLAREGGVSDSRNDGMIETGEVYQMHLARTRLVVLSACETGIERQYRGEGAIGLTRPFLVKGVPLTIASLWPVETDSAAELMNRFHRHRKRDPVSTVEALARAQRDLIEGEDLNYRQPYFWASFVAIGGYAEF